MAKRMDTMDFERFSGCACLNLRKAARAVTQYYDGALRPSGLRATQFSILAALVAEGSATITALAQELVMDRTTLTRDLKLLGKMGLVEISPGADRRTRVARVSDRGRTAVYRAVPLWEEAQSRVVKGIGKKRWRKLVRRLERTVSLVREELPGEDL